MRIQKIWDNFFFTPGLVLNLALTRVVFVGSQLYFLLFWTPLSSALSLLALPSQFFDPLPLLRLALSLGGDGSTPPSGFLIEFVYYSLLFLGFTSLIGLFTRASLFLFSILSLFYQAFLYSYGELHHAEGIYLVVMLLLAFSDSGKSLSLDSYLASRGEDARVPDSSVSVWPLKVGHLLISMAFFSAGFEKLKNSGLTWMNGDTLKFYFISSEYAQTVPLSVWLQDSSFFLVSLSVITIIFELTFFITLRYPKVLRFYAPIGIVFHLANWFLIGICFFQFMVLYSIFINWAHLKRAITTGDRKLPLNQG